MRKVSTYSVTLPNGVVETVKSSREVNFVGAVPNPVTGAWLVGCWSKTEAGAVRFGGFDMLDGQGNFVLVKPRLFKCTKEST